MWSYGMGYYQARPATMERHRYRIDHHPRALQKLTRALNGQSEFSLFGTDYARSKGDPGPLLRPWYNKRTLGLIHEDKPGGVLFSPELTGRLLTGFRFLMPFYEYFVSLEQEAAELENPN